MTWFPTFDWTRLWTRSRSTQLPRAEPRPKFDYVLSYVTNAVNMVDGRYPVTVQEVYRDGSIIGDAQVTRLVSAVELDAYARRAENILPGASWGIRFV